jgi:prophage regulatory protein
MSSSTDMAREHEPKGVRPLEGTNTTPLLLTAEQVAHLIQISPRTLWRLVSSKQIVGPMKIGGATRWPRSAVEQWIAAGCPAMTARENGTRR